MRFIPWILSCVVLFSTACSSTFSPFPKTEEHIVGFGDTVYSIAFENDLDYRDLARWNDIDPPYKIYTGQMLVLHGYHPLAKGSDSGTASAAKSKGPRESKIKTQPIQQASSGEIREVEVKPLPPKEAPQPVKRVPDKSAEPAKPGKPADSAKPSVAVVPPPVVKPAVVVKADPPVEKPAPLPKKWDIPKYDDPWIWPVRGAILDKFSATNKGIDIAGKVGTPVRSTAAGKVVYAGEGLKGYGLLLIVKHDQNYLSAYGHNERLLVVQGESVKQGQPIATLGRGPENRSMLHFELRRNGKPVNPEKMLPK